MSTQAPTPSPPTGERGTILTHPDVGAPGWSRIAESNERVPELVFPSSIDTYQAMQADPQVHALLSGITLPVRRFEWFVDPAGAPISAAQRLADDLGLPLRRREDDAIERPNDETWDDFVRHALKALAYGFMPFEIVGRIEAGRFRFDRLSERLPHTIREIQVARTGMPTALIQEGGQQGITIPMERVVLFVWERDGSNWYGRSILRPLYQPWLLKDELLRIDLIRHRRNGMGVPIVELAEGASQKQVDAAAQLAEAYRVGDGAGGSTPAGMRLRLVGVEGGTSNPLESIRYHDEAMARAMQEELRQLGSTAHGSRALGESFEATMIVAILQAADWLRGIVNRQAVTKWAEWNGLTKVPRVTFDPDQATADEIALLVREGLLKPDPPLEAWLRRKYGLPQREESAPLPSGPAPPAPSPAGETEAVNAAAAPVPEGLGFQPDVIAASLDRHQEEVEAVVADYIAWLTDQIGEAADEASTLEELEAMVEVEPPPELVDRMAAILASQEAEGAEFARQEAQTQGRSGALRGALGDAQGPGRLARRFLRAAGRRLRNLVTSRAELSTGDGSELFGDIRDLARQEAESARTRIAGDTANAAVVAANQQGRERVWAQDAPDYWLATEVLDASICEECAGIDGTRFDTWDEAEAAYPSGQYHACLGRQRCRGQLVAVYGGPVQAKRSRPPKIGTARRPDGHEQLVIE